MVTDPARSQNSWPLGAPPVSGALDRDLLGFGGRQGPRSRVPNLRLSGSPENVTSGPADEWKQQQRLEP